MIGDLLFIEKSDRTKFNVSGQNPPVYLRTVFEGKTGGRLIQINERLLPSPLQAKEHSPHAVSIIQPRLSHNAQREAEKHVLWEEYGKFLFGIADTIEELRAKDAFNV